MRARNLLIIPLLFVCQSAGMAQETGRIPDFSEGFKKLAALGMPALDSQAKWILSANANDTDYELRQLTKSLKGNAWLLPATDGKPRIVTLGGVRIVDMDSKKSEPAKVQDLAKDTHAIIAALEKATAKRDSDDSFSSSSRGSGFGNLLLFATQLHQNGQPDLANQLATAVFGFFPTREAAVDSAIDQLAEHFYQKAATDFFSSGDWAAYHKALADLINRYPRGWAARDAVGIFMPQLEKQAAGTKAPPPALPEIAIDPRATEIIREFTEKPPVDPNAAKAGENNPRGMSPGMRYRLQMMGDYEDGGYSPSALWLIGDPAESADEKSPLSRLAALKMAALPALAALASDPFLTHLPNSRSYSGYSSDESGDERTIRIHAGLNRPATRGELARKLLVATLPDAQDELNNADPDTVRDLALGFWKEHKTATRDELAAVFLRDGSRGQSSQAATILASSNDPKAQQVFETHVLASEQAISCFQEVQIYLRARKALGKAFFESYAKLVRSQTPESEDDNQGYNENSWMIKQAGGVEKILKQLGGLTGGQSPRALAVQIAKGKPGDAAAAMKLLDSLLTDAPPTKHLFALLEGAIAATDPAVRARFLNATQSIRWIPENGGEHDNSAQAAERKIIEQEATVWRKLIADESKIPNNSGGFPGREEISSIADLAAMSLEYSVSPEGYEALIEAAPVLDKSVTAVTRERSAARLSGKPVPPLPDAKRVSKERLAAIVAEAGKTPSAGIHPYLKTLTPDERAAWLQWYDEPGELPYPESVRELQSVIITRSASGKPSPEKTGIGKIDVGYRISPAGIAREIESSAPEMEKHSRTMIHISPAEFGPGLEISTNVFPEPAAKPDSAAGEPDEDNEDGRLQSMPLRHVFSEAISLLKNNTTSSAAAILFVSSNANNQSSDWLIQDGKATLHKSDEPSDDNDQPSVESILKSILESKEHQGFRLQIQILSKADADKLAADSSNETDPFAE